MKYSIKKLETNMINYIEMPVSILISDVLLFDTVSIG
jgi:hypothetical protein